LVHFIVLNEFELLLLAQILDTIDEAQLVFVQQVY